MELVNTKSECTIGVVEADENDDIEVYRPVIMWNIAINSYLSEKDSTYRAYGCTVKVKGNQGEIKSFHVFIKDADFSKFERVRSAIVNQTHGQLILNSRFDPSLWTDFVPKLLFDCSDRIEHCRPARNIGLQWHYLQSMAFNHGGVLQLDHVEIVYNDIVYNGLGEELNSPVNILVPDAFPNKTFRVSDFKPSGLRGFLKNCLPPYTSTSRFRREQQVLVIVGALGQHFYRLIVHNTGSCPSLMLASYEPETQKSTAALVGLKAVSDPKQFFNLQSSAAAVTEQRSTSSLPTVYDDVENDSGHNKMMVGSMNAASKFTKGDGEEEQLGGTVYTKNLRVGMKMPAKIIEGRNNWLLMEKDDTYEEEDIGENCEQNFEHCNEMTSVMMPRDFLAKLTRYFIIEEGQQLSFFQEAQREACEIMNTRRPHWRKRKSKSASLFLSMFFLLEKEVSEANDDISKEIFVEIFDSRDNYIEVLMKALDRVDEVEATMAEGTPMAIPSWIYDDNPVANEDEGDASDIDKLVMETLDIIEDLNEVDKTKFAKIFNTNGRTLAIQHAKVKALAKEKLLPVPKFMNQKKNYPSFVTLKTETFTKPTALASSGSINTMSGFCTSILFKKLSSDTRLRVLESLGVSNEEAVTEPMEDHEDDLDLNPAASQDYPQFSQSQSTETLKVCEFCDFKTRSKVDFANHIIVHPKCQVCKKCFTDGNSLEEHIDVHKTEKCAKCGIEVPKVSLKNHLESHELGAIYKISLNKTKSKKRKQTDSEAPASIQPRLNSFLVFCRTFREEKKQMFPQLDMLGINKKLREDWSLLSVEEKAAYKPSSSSTANLTSVTPSLTLVLTPSSTVSPVTVTSSMARPDPLPTLSESVSPTIGLTTPSTVQLLDSLPVMTTSSLDPGQTTIQKCDMCGRMFFTKMALENHKTDEHSRIHNLTPARQSQMEEGLGSSDDNDNNDEDIRAEIMNGSTKVLYWYKIKQLVWPCLLDNRLQSGQEIVKVSMFDDRETAVDAEVSKLKPFSPLSRIPKSRTAEWKRCYERALAVFEQID